MITPELLRFVIVPELIIPAAPLPPAAPEPPGPPAPPATPAAPVFPTSPVTLALLLVEVVIVIVPPKTKGETALNAKAKATSTLRILNNSIGRLSFVFNGKGRG